MAGTWLHWLWLSDGGLVVRIGVGVAIFVVLAVVDYRRKGRAATRWREYLFLVVSVAAAMAYGLANDMITVTICPEYFIAHENLPPDTTGLRAVAAVVGLKATWSLGLILGAAMLIANNPSKRRPKLPYRRMWTKLIYPFALAAAGATGMGLAAWFGALDWWLGPPEPPLLRGFNCVYSAHTGAYAGGLLGGVAAVIAIRLQRRRLSDNSPGRIISH